MLDARARARFRRNRSAVVATASLAALVAFAGLGPLAASHDPLTSDFARGATASGMPVGPNRVFLLGADRLFRDVFARLAYAGRLSLFIAVSSTAIATGIGLGVGLCAGWTEGRRMRVPWAAVALVCAAVVAFLSGWPRLGILVAAMGGGLAAIGRLGTAGILVDTDGLLMRAVDVMLAFPFLLLVMAVGAAFEQTSAGAIFVTLGATGWVGIARVLRAKTMQVRSLEYVTASRALGRSTIGILLRHVLPNVAGPLVVSATVLVAQMLVADSVLAYLGLGIAPPTPTWGRMLFEGQDYYLVAPWLVIAPGALIALAVWAFNMLGEGLRDALDPHEN